MSTLKRIATELQQLQQLRQDPPEQFLAAPVGNGSLQWQAILLGPPDSPYHGGAFILEIHFPALYPLLSPEIVFLTPIYHPNILAIYECLKPVVWKPNMNIRYLLSSIYGLLCNPNLDKPLISAIACIYKTDREMFDRTARKWTERYAMASPKLDKRFADGVWKQSTSTRVRDRLVFLRTSSRGRIL
eukprot:scpid96035/ scgid34720/ Ubiquitin-conjugating enzyme E2 D2; Ubiquitin carrier protein D2; Ubiquitin-conjugating enzyme E2(17)KB 2; Ubiquitin-conjugating enzyme E2-17 kDa 2; Ubiquitin-protein ligase D2 &gt; Ubiquitin-conjugating enzyme E2 D2; Ubiquitin carrier protein D2; Ubiquitin-conjugating enzyme E2(17)KB 2; Ubiquitin-conjugating enzyme E2-17 kDa 2; Ubiquitin-protein ligase D2 &gt; Ubiquitin-conjugating enzyme E2 D2; Ubiquitin carrier protein D2; Ubiquitin-conjugating enzyme E2(17)KB 2; Ubiqu